LDLELTGGDDFCSAMKCIFAVEQFVVHKKLFSLVRFKEEAEKLPKSSNVE
jgi:hypothetical protein